MGSQYPAECLPMVDPGNAPLIRIDGLESYEISDGWAFSRYYVEEPVAGGSAMVVMLRPRVRRICLALVCRQEAQLEIRRQVEDATGLYRMANFGH